MFVLDASDPGRLQEGWEAFESVLSSERAAGLPLLLLANKRDVEGALTVQEIREGFEARERARDAERDEMEMMGGAADSKPVAGKANDSTALDKGKSPAASVTPGINDDDRDPGTITSEAGAGRRDAAGMYAERAERIASLDVLGVSALTG